MLKNGATMTSIATDDDEDDDDYDDEDDDEEDTDYDNDKEDEFDDPAAVRRIETKMTLKSNVERKKNSLRESETEAEEIFKWTPGNVLGKGAFGTVVCGMTQL